MKVVLFCGGLGLRIRDGSQRVPKPLVPIGDRPILWHIMKYYAHFGHTDFILCLGHEGNQIKDYFLNYEETLCNDFVLADGGRRVQLLQRDLEDWTITFVDTGVHASVGERLKLVEGHLDGSELFLASYGDGLTDAPLPQMVSALLERGAAASFLCVPPRQSFHFVDLAPDASVLGIREMAGSGLRVNGGFFVLRRSIFDYIEWGEDLVNEPFRRLAAESLLLGYPYDGFWAPMDTLKDKEELDLLVSTGHAPWRVWDARRPNGSSNGSLVRC